MNRKRRVFGPAFEAKVAVAVRRDKTTAQLAAQSGGHASQIASWKRSLLERVPELFFDGRTRKVHEASADEQELFEQIGRLTIEVEWLKKGCRARLRENANGSSQDIPD